MNRLLELVSEFSKATGYKIDIQKSGVLRHTNNELGECMPKLTKRW